MVRRRSLTIGALLRVGLPVLMLVGLPSGCGASGHVTAQSASFIDGGVAVSIRVVPSSSGRGTMTATFRPTMPGFHVYSVDLPQGGIDGLGLRTSVRLSGGLTGTTTLTTRSSVQQLPYPSLGLALPVYPDGPVTFTAGVRATSAATTVATIGYAACSDQLCLLPVREHTVALSPSRA